MSASTPLLEPNRGFISTRPNGCCEYYGPQAAGPVTPARTGKVQSPAPGAKRAAGGPKIGGGISLSMPARQGHAAPPKKGR
jgi:hypothetical protein